MEKEKFLPYFELCRHYFDIADKFVKSEPVKVGDLVKDHVSETVYQQDFVLVVQCLVKYSHALLDSLITSCVDYLPSDNKFYDSSKLDICDFRL